MPDATTRPTAQRATYIGSAVFTIAVLTDLTISWVRMAQHFTPPMLVFRGVEAAIKLTLLVFVLRGRRWAFIGQIVLSSLAFLSAIALIGQANRRPVGDPLVWISLLAQVLAGIYCILRLARTQATSAQTYIES